MICSKQVDNNEIFYKHVFWHTNINVQLQTANLVLHEDGTADGDGDPNPDRNTFKVFKASAGWCNNFISRNELGSYIMKGEKGSNNQEAADTFVHDFNLFHTENSSENVIKIIINFDEGGVQYKSIPRKSYIDKKIAVKAKKTIKSRFTIMVGTAMDGFKFKPLVIGKSANPRCFKTE